jgi:hypothetical protein
VIRRHKVAINRAIKVANDTDTDRFKPGPKRKFVKELSVQLWSMLLWNALTAKHPAYEGESEVRMISLSPVGDPAAKIETRTARSELIPFIGMPIDFARKKLIASIMSGPCSPEMSEQAATVMVGSLHRKNRLKQTDLELLGVITRSPIPYRG